MLPLLNFIKRARQFNFSCNFPETNWLVLKYEVPLDHLHVPSPQKYSERNSLSYYLSLKARFYVSKLSPPVQTSPIKTNGTLGKPFKKAGSFNALAIQLRYNTQNPNHKSTIITIQGSTHYPIPNFHSQSINTQVNLNHNQHPKSKAPVPFPRKN